MVHLMLYSRPGCHLCDEMKAVVATVAATMPISLVEIDISIDAALEREFGLEIPVLLVGGRKAAKYRVSVEELQRIVQGRSAEGG
jgi:hypothetical protein